ncbi:MAG: hypothetical protein IFK91_02880 [Acidobacteria bacterium]|nr:hypothetical protein [Candidatus Sulfomarinibacter sp. MAG AM1]
MPPRNLAPPTSAVPAEVLQDARQDGRVGTALRPDATRQPATGAATGAGGFTAPAAGGRHDGATIAIGIIAVGTVASG